MKKKRNWKPILTTLLVLFALVYVAPSFMPEDTFSDDWKRLNYGLDLQGGLELRYTVDYKRALADNTWKVAGLLRDRIIAEHLGKSDDTAAITPEELKKYRAQVTLERIDYKSARLVFDGDIQKSLDKIDDSFIQLVDNQFVKGESTESTIEFAIKYAEAQRLKKEIVEQTMKIIGKRVDEFGLVEPVIRKAGDADIDVQLPGVDESKMSVVRAMIGQTAQLMFRLLELKGNPMANLGQDLTTYKKLNEGKTLSIELLSGTIGNVTQNFLRAQRKSTLIKFLRWVATQREARGEPPLVDDDHMFGFEELTTRSAGGKESTDGWRSHYVIRNMRVGVGTGEERSISISGDRISKPNVLTDPQTGEPYVSIDFDSRGTKDFGDLTTENVNGYLAIMVDDTVQSYPTIQEPITGGRARVTLGAGSSSEKIQEAQNLAKVLKHGAYKAPVHKVHDHKVGASLGQDSIDKGKRALALGSILVVVFMVFYYRISGMIAIFALTLNILFVVAILVSFNAALTLPGIAGIVLTIGMAVDANVIIFERIREELRAGKSVRAAVDTGYARAFWTIFDANITTALAAWILLLYTTGPIYGFAVTLLAGIICSMFTAIVVTRMLFNWLIQGRKLKTLSI
jgi:preprotein translocase subunit SecD